MGAGGDALDYYAGRVTGLLESAQGADRRFGDRERRSSTMLCIYREKNAVSVLGLVEQAQQRGMTIALWALDNPLPELSSYTVGYGPGPRMDLLNRLWEAVGTVDCHQLVITDDDISFTRGSLDQLLRVAITGEFGIAQPAHDWTSQHTYPITRKRPFLAARLTTFVEPGPMFVVTQPWINQVVPFPKSFGMGWGIWLLWLKLQSEGCKLGIVDCVSVNHHSPVGNDYASASQIEFDRLRSLLLEQNIDKPEDAQKILATWNMGKARPPWSSTA